MKMTQKAIEVRKQWIKEDPKKYAEFAKDPVKIRTINALAQMTAGKEVLR